LSPTDPLEELIALFDSARRQAKEVGELLGSGQSAEALTARLREQAGTMAQLQALLSEFSPERSLRTRSEIKRSIDGMRSDFKDLVKSAEANHRLAARKGVRLTGLGGKPHISPAPPIKRAPEDG